MSRTTRTTIKMITSKVIVALIFFLLTLIHIPRAPDWPEWLADGELDWSIHSASGCYHYHYEL